MLIKQNNQSKQANKSAGVSQIGKVGELAPQKQLTDEELGKLIEHKRVRDEISLSSVTQFNVQEPGSPSLRTDNKSSIKEAQINHIAETPVFTKERRDF